MNTAKESSGKAMGHIKLLYALSIIAIVLSAIAIILLLMVIKRVSSRPSGKGRAQEPQPKPSGQSTKTTTLQNDIFSIRTALAKTSKQISDLQTEVAALKERQQQATPQPTYANQRKQDTTPKIQTRTVYFEETKNGCFKNESDTEDSYSNYVCKITGNDAIFEPINKLEKLKSSGHLKDAATLIGDKDRARDAEIKPGKAVKEGSRWRITEKAVVRFK